MSDIIVTLLLKFEAVAIGIDDNILIYFLSDLSKSRNLLIDKNWRYWKFSNEIGCTEKFSVQGFSKPNRAKAWMDEERKEVKDWNYHVLNFAIYQKLELPYFKFTEPDFRTLRDPSILGEGRIFGPIFWIFWDPVFWSNFGNLLLFS